MKSDLFRVGAFFLLLQSAGICGAQVPSLDSLAGKWLSGSEIVFPPSVTNTTGALGCTENITGFHFCNFPPIAQGGEAADLSVDGKPLVTRRYRWFPYQALREAIAPDGLVFRSTTRLGVSQPSVLIRVEVSNPTKRDIDASLSLKNPTGFRRVPGVWDWSNRGVDPGDGFVHRVGGVEESITDSKSELAVHIASPPASIHLAPGESTTFVLTCGFSAQAPASNEFGLAKTRWEQRWRDAFTPGNPTYSGNLPTLTSQDQKLKRIYYMAIVTLLGMERTGYPHAARCFVTVGPEYATTLEYFWDTALFGNLYALLDPVNFKRNLDSWKAVDLHHHYAIDYLTGEGVGPWYSPNDYSVFTSMWKYATTTGDKAYLSANSTRMVEMAEAWKKLVRPGETLADFGENDNLLECSPAYINMVPSLNAAHVGLMEKALQLCPASQAAGIEGDIKRLSAAVLHQYVPGDGVWKTKHRDGVEVANRHVYDYLTVGLSMTQFLSPKMKQEMTGFVNRELLADGWIRAMSLSDPNAAVSDRPDHGPKGSYAAWPAMAALTMAKFGQYNDMENLIERCEGATWQGPFPQGFELLQVPGTDRWIPRIAIRGCDYNETSGAAFAETVINGLFGVDFGIDGAIHVTDDHVARPVSARLFNLRTKGGLRSLSCGPFGVRTSNAR